MNTLLDVLFFDCDSGLGKLCLDSPVFAEFKSVVSCGIGLHIVAS